MVEGLENKPMALVLLNKLKIKELQRTYHIVQLNSNKWNGQNIKVNRFIQKRKRLIRHLALKRSNFLGKNMNGGQITRNILMTAKPF